MLQFNQQRVDWVMFVSLAAEANIMNLFSTVADAQHYSPGYALSSIAAPAVLAQNAPKDQLANASGFLAAFQLVVGILPGFRRQEANRWVAVPIVTGMDQARNVVLVRSCDALIAVGGMYGTLSEIALALKLGVPVVGLGTWRLRQPAGRPVPIIRAATPEAAVARALRAVRTARRARGPLP